MKENNVIQFKRKRKGLIAGVLVFVVTVGLIVLLTCFHIETMEVTGNEYYSKEEIKEFVIREGYVDNTILLMLKNKINPIDDIPFIAKIEIEYISAHKVAITVYEKAMAGCIEYMNEYVYFDQDGYVLEISSEKIPDVPCISGMSFDSMELYEKLPIEDAERFKTILKMTQLINKYDIHVDAIKFTSENEIVLTHEAIRVELGEGSLLEEQLTDLKQILEGLKGKEGTLDMKDFDATSGKASFKMKS